VTIIDSGLDYSVFNLGVVTGPSIEHGGELEARLACAHAYYQARGVRWSLWMCEDHVAPAARSDVRRHIRRNGFRQIAGPPGMIADQLAPPRRALPDIQVRRVADAAARLSFTHISAVSFDIPFQTARRIYCEEAAWSGTYKGWVGAVGPDVVCCAATVITGDIIGVYSVGTLPAFRRRGYAEALMRKVLDQIRDETGLTKSLLQASDAGESLYADMGYREVTRYAVFLL
jgi:GNAT superfamily N-acetyltransferase